MTNETVKTKKGREAFASLPLIFKEGTAALRASSQFGVFFAESDEPIDPAIPTHTDAA